MCGGEGSIRIEPAENGYTVEAYIPEGKDTPGKHKRLVATTEDGALAAAGKHLRNLKGRRAGTRMMGGEIAASPGPKKKGGGKKKRMAVKR